MYESSSPCESLFPVTGVEPIPSARPMRESRASGALRDLVAIEPHELIYGKLVGDGEGKGTEMAEESVAAAADERLAWSKVGQARLERSSFSRRAKNPESIPPPEFLGCKS
jgi:hypothetical protein